MAKDKPTALDDFRGRAIENIKADRKLSKQQSTRNKLKRRAFKDARKRGAGFIEAAQNTRLIEKMEFRPRGKRGDEIQSTRKDIRRREMRRKKKWRIKEFKNDIINV